MTWNYRIVEKEGKIKKYKHYVIMEIYYDDNHKLWAYVDEPAAPHGDNINEIKMDLESLKAAFKYPILKYSKLNRLKK